MIYIVSKILKWQILVLNIYWNSITLAFCSHQIWGTVCSRFNIFTHVAINFTETQLLLGTPFSWITTFFAWWFTKFPESQGLPWQLIVRCFVLLCPVFLVLFIFINIVVLFLVCLFLFFGVFIPVFFLFLLWVSLFL